MTKVRGNTKAEPLEVLIRRVSTDAAAVNAPLTPQVLASAILSAAWTHRTGSGAWLAQLIDQAPTDNPRGLALYLAHRGWKHNTAPVTRPT